MALFPKTPGVYIQEISTLPSSVVAVATAIPAFIGYTEKGPLNTPTRITSLIEYQQTFGDAFHEPYSVNATTLVVTVTLSNYNLFYNLQMYFANGGGPCYIISAGSYTDAIAAPALPSPGLLLALSKAEEVDEVTLLVIPEAVAPSVTQSVVMQAMLDQCNKLQDRF